MYILYVLYRDAQFHIRNILIDRKQMMMPWLHVGFINPLHVILKLVVNYLKSKSSFYGLKMQKQDKNQNGGFYIKIRYLYKKDDNRVIYLKQRFIYEAVIGNE